MPIPWRESAASFRSLVCDCLSQLYNYPDSDINRITSGIPEQLWKHLFEVSKAFTVATILHDSEAVRTTVMDRYLTIYGNKYQQILEDAESRFIIEKSNRSD